MPDLSAERRLVKSPPELWAEVSEVERLAKHLGAFGEIRITKLEPEREVAWEGDHACGTVSIEASGWGTKVKLTAEVPEDSPPPEPPEESPPPEEFERPALPEPEPEPEPDVERPLDAIAPLVEPRKKRGLFSRLFPGWEVQPREPEPEPVVERRDWLESALVSSAASAHAGLDAGALVAPPSQPVAQPEPEPEPEPEPPAAEPEPTIAPNEAQAVLDSVLDNLGAAHHRPFSRG